MLLSAGGYAALAQPLRATDVFEKAAPSVVLVRSESPSKVQGSGVILSTSTETRSMLIATNAHVVGNAVQVTVETTGKRVTGKVLYRDATHDMALVDAPLMGREASIAHAFTPRVGDTVFAIGNPFGLQNSITEGIVSGVRTHGALSLIQTSAAISAGSSGGGLFTGDGRLVGITSSRMLAGENIGFAIHIDHYVDVVGASRLRELIAGALERGADTKERRVLRAAIDTDRFTTWLAFSDAPEGAGLAPERLWLLLERLWERFVKSGNVADRDAFLTRAGEAVEQFFASEASRPSASAGSDDAQLVLLCRWELAGGRRFTSTLRVNIDASTVNGWPARISDSQIVFSTDVSGLFVIDRYSGQGLLRDEDQGRTWTGTCQRAPERRF
jgi:hypothetical protein